MLPNKRLANAIRDDHAKLPYSKTDVAKSFTP